MSVNKIFLSLLSLTFLGACSSNKPEQWQRFFTTEIRTDQSKTFDFALVNNETVASSDRGLKSSNKATNSQRQRNTKKDIDKQLETLLLTELDAELVLNQYCRTGYMIIEKSFRDDLIVRGECNDSATVQDRAQFPNTSKVGQ